MGAYGSPELYPFDNSSNDSETNMIYCRKCGTRFNKSTKKCPNCGTKNKPPFYKRWWFWIIVGFIVMSMFGGNTDNAVIENPQAYMNSCTMFTYDDIFRNSEMYKDKNVCFYGKVMQAEENGSNVVLLVNMTLGDYNIWSDPIWVEYTRSETAVRVLKDDIINVYGVSKGIKKYQAVLGNSNSVPYIKGKIIQLSDFKEPSMSDIIQEKTDEIMDDAMETAEKYMDEVYDKYNSN